MAKEPKKVPTEESVLELLERGPMRPETPNNWNAGSDHMPWEAKTRRILDSLVEKGLVVKKAGGWYRISEAGLAARIKS